MTATGAPAVDAGPARRLDPLGPAASAPADRLAAEDLLFLGATVLAPLDLVLTASLTVYDMLIAGIAILLVCSRRRIQWLPMLFLPAVVVFFAFALLSTFRSLVPQEALLQLAQFGFVFFVQLPVVFTLVRSRRMLELTLAALAVGALVGIGISFALEQVQGAGRAVAFFSDNPNRLGYPAAFLLPFVLYRLFQLRRRGRTARALVEGAVTLYFLFWALTASASRGASAGVVVGLVVYAIFVERVRLDRRTMRRVAAAVAVIGVVALVFARTTWFPQTLRERVGGTIDAESSLVEDREYLALAGIRAVEDSPFIGTGLDNFRYVAQRYEGQSSQQAPHNMWLQFMAQIGLLGTAAFVFVIVTWFELVLRRLRAVADPDDRSLLAAFLASMAALMAIFMTTPVMIHRHYWLLYGLGLVAATGSVLGAVGGRSAGARQDEERPA